jgi:hypothetical protein
MKNNNSKRTNNSLFLFYLETFCLMKSAFTIKGIFSHPRNFYSNFDYICSL